jgi:hypothetical protein
MNKMILTGAGIVGAGLGIKGQAEAAKEYKDADFTLQTALSNGAVNGARFVGYAAAATKLIESAVTKKAPNIGAITFGAGLGAAEGYFQHQREVAYSSKTDDSIGAYAKAMVSSGISGAFLGLGASGIASDLVFHK